MRTGSVSFGWVLAWSLLLSGCSTVTQLEPQLISERFPFIQDGKTSKEEILNRLGEPDHRYQGDQILTYEMCEDLHLKGRLWRTTALCSLERTNKLILVFGPDNLVARHSVVLVK